MNNDVKCRILQELGGLPEDIYDSLVNDLIGQIENQLVSLETALEAGKFDIFFQVAHSLSGAAGNLRLTSLREVLYAMEVEVRGEKDRDVLAKQLDTLKEQFHIFKRTWQDTA